MGQSQAFGRGSHPDPMCYQPACPQQPRRPSRAVTETRRVPPKVQAACSGDLDDPEGGWLREGGDSGSSQLTPGSPLLSCVVSECSGLQQSGFLWCMTAGWKTWADTLVSLCSPIRRNSAGGPAGPKGPRWPHPCGTVVTGAPQKIKHVVRTQPEPGDPSLK